MLLVILMVSCTALFNGVAFPNQCKKCVVVNRNSGAVVHTEEGCGSSNVNLEENAKVYAYDLNARAGSLRFAVECQSWRDETQE